MIDAVYSLHTEDAVVVAWSFSDEARLDIRFRGGGPSFLAEVRLDHGDDEMPAHLSGKWLAIVGGRKNRPVIWRGKECLPFETREEAVASVVARFLSLWREHVKKPSRPLTTGRPVANVGVPGSDAGQKDRNQWASKI